uniref:HTH CENPB-type domain-containing protein n=1 Tax=Panagrolaimus davidi TaxID=227884 RepID=A0A914QVY8_9BILA
MEAKIQYLLLHPEKSFTDLCCIYDGFDEDGYDTNDSFYNSSSDEEDDPTYFPEDEEGRTERRRLEELYSSETWISIIEHRKIGWSFPTLQHRWKLLKYPYEIDRMQAYLKKGGTALKKYESISETVFQEFLQWKQDFQVVHDRDIADSALAAADALDMFDFEASEAWIRRWKKRHRVVSRKVNNFITNKTIANRDKLEDEIEKFRLKYSQYLIDLPLDQVYNSDQTGVQLEMISKRTLDFQGVIKVQARAQSSNSLTHSFTAQPVITASGKLLLPVFVIMHEAHEPQCFNKDLAQFKYITAKSSTSGKSSKYLTSKWFEDVFVKAADKGCDLFVDKWTGWNKCLDNQTFANVHRIPEGTTAELQPLDVFFNRQFKALYRVMSDKIRRRFNDLFKVYDRKGIGRLLHLCFSQLAADRFHDMIKFAWFKAGYIKERPAPFLTPVAYCFDLMDAKSTCEVGDCFDRAFIKCANCTKFIL